MCERFEYDPPLTTLKNWKDDFCSSNLIDDNDETKVAIAKTMAKLCLPCDPRGTTDYVCPKGFSCTRNVLAGDLGCSEYCCTMCKLGEYCPEGSNNIVGKNDATICEEGSACETPAQQIPCPLGHYCLGGGVNRSGAFEAKSCESLWESTTMTIDGKTLSAWDGLYCPENQTLPKLCEAGYYCDSRNGTVRKKCPEGSFCPWGSSEPMPCPWPVHCVEGSAQQPVTFFTLLIVMEALIVKIVVSLYAPVKKLYKKSGTHGRRSSQNGFSPRYPPRAHSTYETS